MSVVITDQETGAGSAGESVERDLGRLEAEQDHIEEKVAEVAAEVDAVEHKIEQVEERQSWHDSEKQEIWKAIRDQAERTESLESTLTGLIEAITTETETETKAETETIENDLPPIAAETETAEMIEPPQSSQKKSLLNLIMFGR